MRALGVDSAGIVDRERNLVLDAPNLRGWERWPLADRLSDALGLPAFLENDVHAMTYGEWRCGAGRGVRHLLCLTLGTGVGGGLVLDGALYRGAHGAGGEVGHVTVQRDGIACPCGAPAAWSATWRASHRPKNFGLPGARSAGERAARDPRSHARRTWGEAAAAGDALAAAVLAETGAWPGWARQPGECPRSRAHHLGGGIARAGEPLLEPARRTLRERAMSVPAEKVEVVTAALGNRASVVGAALLALERVPKT